MSERQTILGAGGAIGSHLARELTRYTGTIRLVGRHPQPVNAGDELFPADLTDREATLAAVEDSAVAYLTAGLPYNYKIWKESWPRVMCNTIEACRTAGAKLVFFDNIYMYGPDHLDDITEDNPINPTSRKGKVRAEILDLLWEAFRKGDIQALVARAADFYGPDSENTSVLGVTVLQPMSQGKKATWMGRTDKRHSFTYTVDAGRATALLGNTPHAYGESWHLPTAPNPWTGREWIEAAARAFQVKPTFMRAGKLALHMAGLFNPVMRELPEMLYQYDRDYVFNSSKFEGRFPFVTTSYEDGFRQWLPLFQA